jgi:hypothetical protein
MIYKSKLQKQMLSDLRETGNYKSQESALFQRERHRDISCMSCPGTSIFHVCRTEGSRGRPPAPGRETLRLFCDKNVNLSLETSGGVATIFNSYFINLVSCNVPATLEFISRTR